MSVLLQALLEAFPQVLAPSSLLQGPGAVRHRTRFLLEQTVRRRSSAARARTLSDSISLRSQPLSPVFQELPLFHKLISSAFSARSNRSLTSGRDSLLGTGSSAGNSALLGVPFGVRASGLPGLLLNPFLFPPRQTQFPSLAIPSSELPRVPISVLPNFVSLGLFPQVSDELTRLGAPQDAFDAIRAIEVALRDDPFATVDQLISRIESGEQVPFGFDDEALQALKSVAGPEATI